MTQQVLERDGLTLDVYWHNTYVDSDPGRQLTKTLPQFKDASGQSAKIYYAAMEIGRTIIIVSKKQLPKVYKVMIDGKEVLRRDGEDLINIQLFEIKSSLICMAGDKSQYGRAIEMFKFYWDNHTELDDAAALEKLPGLFGYTPRAFKKIIDMKARASGYPSGVALREIICNEEHASGWTEEADIQPQALGGRPAAGAAGNAAGETVAEATVTAAGVSGDIFKEEDAEGVNDTVLGMLMEGMPKVG
jgi:hypothetical protein